ncbi:MAG: kelch repeat-containing protein, partial [Bdellovibrionales bacterium]
RVRQKPIIDTAIYCYQKDEMGCGAKVEVLQKLLDGLDKNGKPIKPNPYAFDKEILNPMPATFAQFCAATHSIKPKYVDVGQRESVLAIEEIVSRQNGPLYNKLSEAGYFAEASDSIRKCAILEDLLVVQNELDLSYHKETYKISDLNVIANLTQLQKLTLRYQNVRTIDVLSVIEDDKHRVVGGFRDLKYLDIEGNRVADIAPLAKNKSLEILRLAGNQIGSVAALQGLPSLTLLDIRKNLPTAQCFNSPLLKQCMIARSKWLVQFTNTANTVDLGLMFGQVSEFAGGYVVSGARQGHRSNYVAVLDKQAQTPAGFNVRTGNLQYGHVWSADTKIDDTHVLVTGGWPNYSMNSLEIYDAVQGSRSAVGSMTDSRAGHTATLLNSGLVLVAGGYNSSWSLGTESAQSTAELIDPKAPGGPKVVQRLEMNAPRAWHTATKLADGRVVMIGGFAGSRGVRAMEVFDPSVKRFLPLGNLQQARGGHTITELPDGKFLIAGGFKDNASAVSTAEILDSNTLTTRNTKGDMNFARGMHMAQKLPNGEIIFAGGMSQPFKNDEKGDDDGLSLIDMKDTSFDFKLFPDRDEKGEPKKTSHIGVCQICLDSTEVYLPQEESFVPNPESLNSRRAGSALVPVNTNTGLFSFRIWGGLDSATSMTLESGTVTEDVLN